jgi:uridine kinase
VHAPASTAATLVDLALSRPPTLGSGRLVCLDGPAGSGKTSLAAAVAARVPGSRVVHLDDLYDGWDGLHHVTDRLDDLLRPLAAGRPGTYRRYDWHAGRYAETVTVAPVPLLVLEGVGSGGSRHADLVTVLAWVSAPHDLRMRRGIDRDGETFAARWEHWAREEAALFAREGTEGRADLLVDGTGAAPPRRTAGGADSA